MRKPDQPPNIDTILASDVISRFSEEDYQSFTRRCEEHYWPWDRIRFKARGAKLDPRTAWAMVKLGRMQRYRYLPLCGTDVPLRYNLPDRAQRELMLIDRELAGRISFDDERPLTPSQRERFIISALREEAIASSMLEGAATTHRDAKRMLRAGRQPRTRGERMVYNNYRAISFIREHRDVDLSPEFLLELQRLLTVGTLDDRGHEGRFRTEADDVSVVDDRDGEVLHRPPHAAELGQRLASLCEMANSTEPEPFVHPVVRACILHFQIGYDHPFCDGNGRTARAIFYWSMIRSGYWLFEYLPISRFIYRSPASYGRAYLYAENDDFDVTYFLLYNLRVISLARAELQQYLQRKLSHVRAARRILTDDETLNRRQRELLLHVARNPERPFTIEEHRNTQAVAYDTARNDLLELELKGYLRKTRPGKQYVFYAGPRLDVPSAQRRTLGRSGALGSSRRLV